MAAKPRLIRTKKNGCFQLMESSAWGRYLVPAEDPEGEEVSDDDLEGIQLIEDFPKLPARLWMRFIALAFHYCPERKKKKQSEELEVSIVLLRRADDLTQWKIVVPEQIVTGASVEANFERNCDIETGEICNQFPPPGWVHAGSAHSHNTMAAFFSHTDDENELGVPGMHVVIGKINKRERTYVPNASICLKRCRKTVDFGDVIDGDSGRYFPFHQNVLTMITEKKPEKKDGGHRWPVVMGASRGRSILDEIDGIFDKEDNYLTLDDDMAPPALYDLDEEDLSELSNVSDEEIYQDANSFETSREDKDEDEDENDEDDLDLEEIDDIDDIGDVLTKGWWEEIESGSDEESDSDEDNTDSDEETRKW